jgi:hypothetical protein
MKTAIILLAIVFISCSGSRNDTDDIIVIDLLSAADSKLASVSEIASDVEYIPLETREDCMIKFIQKIVEVKDKIYLKSAGEIMCFDHTGKYLFKLSNSGRGPQEYIFLSDFDISTDGKTLVALTDQKIIEYKISEKDFVFHNSFSLGVPHPLYISLVPGTTNILLTIAPWLGTEETLNILINSSGDTLYKKSNYYRYEKSDQIRSRATWDALQYATGNKACFKEVFSDTVFSITGESNQSIPYLVFESHGTVVSTKFRSDPEFGRNNRYTSSQVAYISEVPRYVFYLCRVKGMQQKIFFDKVENKKLELDHERKLVDDISGGPAIDFNMNAGTAGRFYSSVEALALKNYTANQEFSDKKIKDSNKKTGLKKLADTLDETDNPVLIAIVPKK